MIDASPSIYRQLGQMRDAARSLSSSLGAQDEVAVVAFSRPGAPAAAVFCATGACLPPRLARLIWRASLIPRSRLIYQAVDLTARELFAVIRTGRKAIVLLTELARTAAWV